MGFYEQYNQHLSDRELAFVAKARRFSDGQFADDVHCAFCLGEALASDWYPEWAETVRRAGPWSQAPLSPRNDTTGAAKQAMVLATDYHQFGSNGPIAASPRTIMVSSFDRDAGLGIEEMQPRGIQREDDGLARGHTTGVD
jgi:hypothetical protein